ncbi:hit domain-containing [Pyrenophora seminiperda CCB06]|uniref:Aprataxin-like protein n=1 Tax=Pyrenophora seminiperda CCB06 TaxID=1302712 RepID=A0A3M7M9G0_9PLEO|nr:hit domain-containing [Pyrenophora seminiperda CCB06]
MAKCSTGPLCVRGCLGTYRTTPRSGHQFTSRIVISMRRLTPHLGTRRAPGGLVAGGSHGITRPFQSARGGIRANMSTRNGSHAQSEQTYEAITAEDIAGTEPPSPAQPEVDAASQKRPNAFTELMSQSKKTKSSTVPAADASSKSNAVLTNSGPRDQLFFYIDKPELNPEGRIVEYDDDFVVINDKYPKASVHLLLQPRKPAYYSQHPLRALSTDPAFLAEVRTRCDRLKKLAASELRRLYGGTSLSDQPYHAALEEMMSAPEPPSLEEQAALLPPGRDWSKDILVGVHTHPSMNHLHIHIISSDMHSSCMKHKRHYLSYHTSFFVHLDEFPLEEGSPRYHPGPWPGWDMKCWRCGKNFKNKFATLQKHLDEEFEEWRRE